MKLDGSTINQQSYTCTVIMNDQEIQELLSQLDEQEATYHQYVVSELHKAEVAFKEATSAYEEEKKDLLAAQGAATLWLQFLANKYKKAQESSVTPCLD